jgi:ApbE superfamily uncharacterized protein (UPF0280 family)
MSGGAQVARLPDGRRLHLHHGPIDIVLEAFGLPDAVAEAERRAVARFAAILPELAAELPALRSDRALPVAGAVARRMAAAVAPFRPAFITPMAAVAGAVADEVMAALISGGGIARAYVNDGGDIALHLAPGEALTAAIAAQPGAPDRLRVIHADPVRGIATSGWRGRSWSLGIADAVTVLAADAAAADAAATMIANAVDLPGHPAIARCPACEMQADSDLGARPVTVAVGALRPAEAEAALASGVACAAQLRARGLIAGAALFLQGRARSVGDPTLLRLPDPEPELCRD